MPGGFPKEQGVQCDWSRLKGSGGLYKGRSFSSKIRNHWRILRAWRLVASVHTISIRRPRQKQGDQLKDQGSGTDEEMIVVTWTREVKAEVGRGEILAVFFFPSP